MTDTRGAKRKRMLSGEREEEQTQWVCGGDRQMGGKETQGGIHRERRRRHSGWGGVTDTWGEKRTRGCYSVRDKKSRQSG